MYVSQPALIMTSISGMASGPSVYRTISSANQLEPEGSSSTKNPRWRARDNVGYGSNVIRNNHGLGGEPCAKSVPRAHSCLSGEVTYRQESFAVHSTTTIDAGSWKPLGLQAYQNSAMVYRIKGILDVKVKEHTVLSTDKSVLRRRCTARMQLI